MKRRLQINIFVSDFYSHNSADYKDDPYRESVIDYLLPNDLKLLL